MLSPKQKEWADKIRAYAIEHYADAKGYRWDYIVECWDDAEFEQSWTDYPPKTYREAFADAKQFARLMYEQELNAQP